MNNEFIVKHHSTRPVHARKAHKLQYGNDNKTFHKCFIHTIYIICDANRKIIIFNKRKRTFFMFFSSGERERGVEGAKRKNE